MFDPGHFIRILAAITRGIILRRETHYQSVWPRNCWNAGFFQIIAQNRPLLGENLLPQGGQRFGGEGDGRYDISVPTSAGVQTFTAVFTFTYGEPSTRGGVVAGKVQGKGFHGTFDVTPKKGDCVTAPVTRVHTVNEINFDESFFSGGH